MTWQFIAFTGEVLGTFCFYKLCNALVDVARCRLGEEAMRQGKSHVEIREIRDHSEADDAGS